MIDNWFTMLLDALTQFLPGDPGQLGMGIAIVGALLGGAAWLCGARFSRPVVTLITVAIGTSLGLYVPRHFGWSFNGAAPAVAAALILGVTGYTLHSLWVGVGLGVTMSLWAAIGCWIKLRHNVEWSYPTWPTHGTPLGFAMLIWQELPKDFTHLLPLIAAAALICGVAFSILWPTASLLLGWSCAGATILVMMVLAIVRFNQPKLLSHLAAPLWAQLGALLLLVTLGTVMNWWLSPKPAPEPKAAAKSGGKKSRSRDDDDQDD